MPQYWVLHHVIVEGHINPHYENKLLINPYGGIPEHVPVAVDDYVFLLRGTDYFYGYGRVEVLGSAQADAAGNKVRDIVVRPSLLRTNLARLDQIESMDVFARSPLERIGGAISPLDSEQARALWGLLPADHRPPEPPKEIPDGWEKAGERRTLGGGQGTITKVRDISDKRLGALKRLHPGKQGVTERRFRLQREVESLEALGGKGVPVVLAKNTELWRDKGVELYVIMEWIDGPNLREFVQRRRMSLDQAVKTTLALLDILDRCHQLDIYHRDIKPENVMLRGGDPSSPIIVDFGMAFAPSLDDAGADVKTAAGQELGNRFLRLPEYAPNAHSFGAISDLTHLLGLLLYMLTARNPVQLQDANGRMPQEALADRIPQEITADARWPRLETTFTTGFQYRTDRRFSSSDDLRRELLRLLPGAKASDEEHLIDALKELELLRDREEVRVPKLAPPVIRRVSEELMDSLSKAARAKGFEFSRQPFGSGEISPGKPVGNLLFDIAKSDQKGIGADGAHSIYLEDGQYVAYYQTNHTGRVEYYRKPADRPDLLADAVKEVVSPLLTALVESYTDTLRQNTAGLPFE
jgi:serine/threonine protein kinase